MRRRVLVLTRDLIPQPGHFTSGGGLRAWGLGESLRMKGHDVVYSVPRAVVPEGDDFDELRRLAFDPDDLQTTLLRAEADVLLLEQWGLATYLPDNTLPTILDLHGSLILENAYRHHRSLTSNAAAKIKALQKADLVLCPASRQRAYFMAWMMMSGVDPRNIPIEVVPVSMPPELPARTASDDGPLTFVYGGQLWPWIQSEIVLDATAEVLDETGAGKCHLFVKTPELKDVMPHDTSTRVQQSGLSETVTGSDSMVLEGVIPHDELIARYAGAHLALDIYAHNSERELAYTTRTVEYLWCGIPVLYADYGELGALIKEYEAGWVVPPDDVGAIKGALEEAIGDRAELGRRSENARRLVQEKLTWDRTGGALARYVDDPQVRDKGTTIFGKLALEFDRISSEAKTHVTDLRRETDYLASEVEKRDRQVGDLHNELAKVARLNTRMLAARENRIAELSDFLNQRDRQFTEHVDRTAHDRSQLQDRASQVAADLEEAWEISGQFESQLEATKEMLCMEQDDHRQTTQLYEDTRGELDRARHESKELAEELELVKKKLSAAQQKNDDLATSTAERIETLERQLRQGADRELDQKSELASEVAHVDELKGAISKRDEERQLQKEEISRLRRAVKDGKEDWIHRTVETGSHSWKRVAIQVPSLAGLFIRNLANNAYMTVWQKKHNVRIFPGQ